ncbi:MAG: FecR domain-containing protein [Deltaproteobacteria bacterium]|nr:FecR domain-containing protein [Deltaproteobacteria bacterium]MCL5276543.1 FecR domain-containing protein [Deltaproteobacteria bacterium]
MKRLIITFVVVCLPIRAIARPVGYLVSATGTVKLVRDHNVLPPDIGTGILKDDTILTGHDGKVRILFIDNSVINIGGGSDIAIGKYILAPSKREVLLSMARGEIRFLVSKLSTIFTTYDIKTPTAVIGIRGTDFVVDASHKNTTDVYVIEGRVNLWNVLQKPSQAVKLIDGMMSRVEGGTPPTLPIKYTEQKIRRLIKETRIKLSAGIRREVYAFTRRLKKLQAERIEKNREIGQIVRQNQAAMLTKVQELNQDIKNISSEIDTQLKAEKKNIHSVISRSLKVRRPMVPSRHTHGQ